MLVPITNSYHIVTNLEGVTLETCEATASSGCWWESTKSPLSNTWAHRPLWLASNARIDRGDSSTTIPPRKISQPVLCMISTHNALTFLLCPSGTYFLVLHRKVAIIVYNNKNHVQRSPSIHYGTNYWCFFLFYFFYVYQNMDGVSHMQRF